MATTTKGTSSTVDELAAGTEDAARRLVDTISEVSAEAGDRLGAVAGSAGHAVREADRTLRASSDQTLGIVGALSIGVAAGLFAGGANRLLIIVALLPAILVAMAAVERVDRGGPTAGKRMS